MKATGLKIICMALGFIHGKMAADTREHMSGIGNMALESILGLMAVATKACGTMAVNTERAIMLLSRAILQDVESGWMVNGKNGNDLK